VPCLKDMATCALRSGMRCSKLCGLALVAAGVLAATATLAGAQDLRVRLLDAETRQPLAGVLVSAVNPGGAMGPAVLASADGIATVRLTGAGSHRLLIRRIGFAPVTTDQVAVPAESGQLLEIMVLVHRITLSTVRVVGSQACAEQTESPSAGAQAAWTEIRTALEASTLTRDQRMVTTTGLRFQRELRPDGTVAFVDTTLRGRSGERPFFAHAPGALEQDGYFKRHDDGTEDFYGPDEEVLLSAGFTRRHCVSVFPDVRRDSTGTQLALAFAPRDRDTRPEIRGLIWVDSATSELRRIEFEYVRISFPAPADSVGGSVEFTHLASGAWIVSAWVLRMPRFSVGSSRYNMVLDGYLEVGGSASVVHEVATPAAAAPRSVVGSVFDSITHRPLSGARVHLADLGRDAVADSAGAFRFDSVSAGLHSVWADHPRLDTLGLFALGARIDVTPLLVTNITLAIPSFATLWRRACGADPPAGGGDGFVFGRVLGAARPMPGSGAAGTVIDAFWAPSAANGARGPAAVTRRTVHPDSTGNYAICGIPEAELVTIAATEGDTATMPVSFRLGAARIARRDLTIPSSDAMQQALVDPSAVAPMSASDGGTLAGVVHDSTGAPVHGARVTVSGVAHEWRTGADGKFVARGIPPGTRVASISALGYVPERRMVDLAPRDSAFLNLPVTRLITILGAVTVRERERFNAIKSELDQRRRAGWGYMADSAALEKLPSVAAAFNFPRVHIYKQGGADWKIYMTSGVLTMPQGGRGGGTDCFPTIWIDGAISDIEILNALTKEEIGLIEVYTSAASAPLQYSGTRTNCGIVLVWRKRFISR
jgi:hypothetical protein